MMSADAVVSPYSTRMVTVDSGDDFSVEARGVFDDVDDISAVPDTVHTGPRRPAPGADSRADRRGGAKSGDVVAVDLIELTPIGVGKSAILREFGMLRREFPQRARAHHGAKDRALERPIIAQGGVLILSRSGGRGSHRRPSAPRCRFRGCMYRPRAGGGLHAAEHHRRTVSDLAAAGHGNPADRPRGTIAGRRLERQTAWVPFPRKESRNRPPSGIRGAPLVVRPKGAPNPSQVSSNSPCRQGRFTHSALGGAYPDRRGATLACVRDWPQQRDQREETMKAFLRYLGLSAAVGTLLAPAGALGPNS
jgi:hypothetical protein